MSLIDDFAKSNLVQSVRDRFVPLTGGGTPDPASARGDALSPMKTPPSSGQGVFNAPGKADIPTLTHPFRDPYTATQPGQALGDAQRARGTSGMTAPEPAANVRAAFGAQPGAGLADAASAPRPPATGAPLSDTAAATRAAFNTQPGQAFAQASGMTNPGNGPDPFQERMARMHAQSTAAAGPAAPTGVQAGSLDDAMRAATLRNGAQPGEALAGRIASGPPQGAVGVGGGAGGAGIPPGGAVPGAAGGGGGGWYNRFTNAASDAMRPAVPSLGGTGNSLIGKAAAATLGAGAAIAKKAAPWVAPVVEGADVATVALDPASSKADVVEQVGVGATRAGSAMIGAGLGSMAGALTGPAAPIASPVLGIAGGIGGYMAGDAGIRKMREWMGLPNELPAERAQARAQVPQMMAKIDTANKSSANDKAANNIMNDPTGASQQALVDAFKPQGQQQPAAAAPGAAPAAPGAAPAPAMQQASAPAAAAPAQSNIQMAALEAAQKESPIAFTTIGGGQAPQVYYKDGSMTALQPGQAMPADVAEFNERQKAMSALLDGRGAPGAAPAAPAAPASPGFNPKTPLTPIQQAIYDQAGKKGLDPVTAMTIGSIETGGKFNLDAKNPKSTARGPFQLLGANRAAYGLPANGAAPMEQEIDAGLRFMADNNAALGKALGRQPTTTEAYLGHLLGASGGATVLKADPNAPIQNVIAGYDKKNAAAIVKNNGMSGMTVGQALAMWDQKVQQHAANYSGGAPAQQQAAAPAAGAPSGGTGVAQPVHVIQGMNQFMAMPTGGPAMTNVPKTIVDAARQKGNVQAGVQEYLGDVNQGINYKNNPASAKLDETELQGQYQNEGQRIAGRSQNESSRISGAAQNESSRIAAAANVEVAKLGQDNQRYMTAGGGVDPQTMMPRPTTVFDKRDGKAVDMTPKAFPKAPSAALEHLAANAHDPAYVESFIKHFGHERYQTFLKNGK